MSLRRLEGWSTCLGNFFEHYDTALFGFLSAFLAPLIFPNDDPVTALILAYAMIPLGMLARPIGALFFGRIGDRYGPRKALVLTLGGMGIVSASMACIPLYKEIGLAAPILFCAARGLQNFFSAGETIGGALVLLENSPKHRHDLLSSLYDTTTIGGILLASAGVSLLCHAQMITWGWRFLYFFGAVTAFFGWVIRHSLVKEITPVKTSNPLRVFWTHRKALLQIAIIAGFSYANYSIALILMNGFIPLISPITKEVMIGLNTVLLIFDFCLLPFFGYLSSKFARERVMIASSFGILCSSPIFFAILPHASLTTIILIRMWFVMLGVAFAAPFHAFARELIPKEHRYSVISFGYALGSQLLGGPAAALSLWTFHKTGMAISAVWYWAFLAILSTLTLLKTKEKLAWRSS